MTSILGGSFPGISRTIVTSVTVSQRSPPLWGKNRSTQLITRLFKQPILKYIWNTHSYFSLRSANYSFTEIVRVKTNTIESYHGWGQGLQFTVKVLLPPPRGFQGSQETNHHIETTLLGWLCRLTMEASTSKHPDHSTCIYFY